MISALTWDFGEGLSFSCSTKDSLVSVFPVCTMRIIAKPYSPGGL